MSSINTLYKLVIDDVIKNIKPEFESEEIDLSILHFLQKVRLFYSKQKTQKEQ